MPRQALRGPWMLLAALPACLTSSPPRTALEIADAPRHPDGVMLDPPSALPRATLSAPARGIVLLEPPIGEDEAIALVRAFFDAFVSEDLARLTTLVTQDAVPLDAHRQAAASALPDAWRQRLARLDYKKLAGAPLFQPDRVTRLGYGDLGGAGERSRPGEMKEGDLLLRVPVETPRTGERFFGDVVTMLARREGGKLKIAGYYEEPVP